MANKINFICPICKNELSKFDRSLICKNKHSYDISKSGYVNLFISQKSKDKFHGDSKDMVLARSRFLDKGFYSCLLQSLSEVILKYSKDGIRIIDAGCGECYYTKGIKEKLDSNNIDNSILGIDISKDALNYGAKRIKDIDLAVASVFHIPVKDNVCDIVLSVFAPFCKDEFDRILRQYGIIIRVIPLENHLLSLKSLVYNNPYKNTVDDFELSGFKFIEKIEVKKTISLQSEDDIKNLFTMTPYYYKTSFEDRKKLDNVSSFDTQIEFGILIYKK